MPMTCGERMAPPESSGKLNGYEEVIHVALLPEDHLRLSVQFLEVEDLSVWIAELLRAWSSDGLDDDPQPVSPTRPGRARIAKSGVRFLIIRPSSENGLILPGRRLGTPPGPPSQSSRPRPYWLVRSVPNSRRLSSARGIACPAPRCGVPHVWVGQFSIGHPGSVLHRRLPEPRAPPLSTIGGTMR